MINWLLGNYDYSNLINLPKLKKEKKFQNENIFI